MPASCEYLSLHFFAKTGVTSTSLGSKRPVGICGVRAIPEDIGISLVSCVDPAAQVLNWQPLLAPVTYIQLITKDNGLPAVEYSPSENGTLRPMKLAREQHFSQCRAGACL